MFCFLQLMVAFITMMLLLPIHDENMYAFLTLPSTKRAIMLPNVLLVLTFYTALLEMVLMLMSTVGATTLTLCVVLGVIGVFLPVLFLTLSYSYNIALAGSFYGATPLLTKHDDAKASPAAIENRLILPLLRWRKKHGKKDPPAAGFYPAPDKDQPAAMGLPRGLVGAKKRKELGRPQKKLGGVIAAIL